MQFNGWIVWLPPLLIVLAIVAIVIVRKRGQTKPTRRALALMYVAIAVLAGVELYGLIGSD